MSTIHSIGGYQVSDQVLAAVQEASQRTGIDFAYMMAKAAQESAFQPTAVAGSTNATGLYQFIDSTWLAMIKENGATYGLGQYADRITVRQDGSLAVTDAAARREILALREDPRLNAIMAGEYALDNREYLERNVGGRIGSTELYLAHFLGAGGATTFLRQLRHDPDQTAASVFPAAARYNYNVFYNSNTGQPRSLQQVYDWMDRRMQQGIATMGGVPSTGAYAGTGTEAPLRPMVTAPHFAAARSVTAIPQASAYTAMHPGAALGQRLAALSGAAAGSGPTPAGGTSLSLWTLLTASALPVPGDAGGELPGAA
ncbi:MAG: transglycosylase SLT domain-containing protein [Rhodospirillaceae bacterium]|nr:transglycosylase SLT domain-containing protein [Rhodospirillaceae bacterium]